MAMALIPLITGHAETRGGSDQCRKPAFTVLELLVVIAIISILAALLLPAMNRSKQKAQGVQCLNSNRQLTVAWLMYVHDSQDRLPYAVTVDTNLPSWVPGVLDITLPMKPDNWDAARTIMLSPLWPYCGKSAEIWHCPGDKSTGINAQGQAVPRVRSRSMNRHIGGSEVDTNLPGFSVTKLGEILHSENTFLLVDEREDSINDGAFYVDMTGYPDASKAILQDYPASYHNKAAGFTFVDGHSEIHRWQDSRTMPPVSSQGVPHKLPQPYNPDILWMQQRAMGN